MGLTDSNRGPFLAANQQHAPALGGTEPICMLESILKRLQAHAMIWAVLLAVMLIDDAAMLALAFC